MFACFCMFSMRLLISITDKFNYLIIKIFTYKLSPRSVNTFLAIGIYLFECTSYASCNFIGFTYLFLIFTKGLINIPCDLELLIKVKTLANPVTYLLNKSSRLAKKSDLVLLDYCYYRHDYISSCCCPLPTTTIIYYCYHYYY